MYLYIRNSDGYILCMVLEYFITRYSSYHSDKFKVNILNFTVNNLCREKKFTAKRNNHNMEYLFILFFVSSQLVMYHQLSYIFLTTQLNENNVWT